MSIHKSAIVSLVVLLSTSIGGLAAGNYSVTKHVVEGHTTYHLLDSGRKMDFGVVPDIGNFAYEFKVNGKDVLIPSPSFKTYLDNHKFCCGIPFLEPWANRIDHDYFYFQNKKYLLNPDMGNLRRDQFQQVIHGLLVYDTRWEVAKTGASDADGAFITSRLEFYKYPDLMAQFPFAHTIEMTYRLKDGKLENSTAIKNVSLAAMPIHIAYHPYFHPDGDRETWTVSNGAQNYWVLNDRLTPTGEKRPAEELMPNREDYLVGKKPLDNLFSDLERGADGLGHVWVKGMTEKIEMLYSKEYDFAVIYAPLLPSPPLICIEPQTGPTNAFNLNHDGKFPGLVALEPGKTFTARFWIVPTDF